MTITDHSRATADTAHTHGGVIPARSRAERPVSFDVDDFPMPTGREEEWRFTPMSRLAPLLADTPSTGHVGWTLGSMPVGVTLTEIDPTTARARSVRAPGDRVSAVAAKHSTQSKFLAVAPGVSVSRPVEVGLRGKGDTLRGHFLVEAGAGSTATVILDYSGTGTLAEFMSIDVAEGASLTLVLLYGWDLDAVHSPEVVVRTGRDACLRVSVATLGGGVVRSSLSVAMEGEGGSVDVFGVYFARSGQHHEHRTFIDHAAPRCRSRVTYKGALSGATARTVWVGDVLIRAEAEGTDTYEVNRNLILSDGARADSVPNLEIQTGEIAGAGHASATGRFDDEQVFYLRSRGIPEAEARKLVVKGFFADVVHQIGVPRIEKDLMTSIESELEATSD